MRPASHSISMAACTCGLVVALAVALVMAACRPQEPFSEYQAVDAHGWSSTDTLRFDLPRQELPAAYGVMLGVRHTEAYPYTELWVALEQRTAGRHGTTARRDTIHLLLANAAGQWLTPHPTLHTCEQPAATIRLTPDSAVQLLVYHLMPRQLLEGITDIGLTLTPAHQHQP